MSAPSTYWCSAPTTFTGWTRARCWPSTSKLGAAATVAAIRVPPEQARGFGVIEPGEGTLIDRFVEKPPDPVALAAGRDHLFASMGNYIFTAEALVDALREDAQDANSRHDMGGDIVPRFVESGDAHLYDFYHERGPRGQRARAGLLE